MLFRVPLFPFKVNSAFRVSILQLFESIKQLLKLKVDVTNLATFGRQYFQTHNYNSQYVAKLHQWI